MSRYARHYLIVTADCPASIVLRVPLPMPSRKDLMKALAPVMREHGCRQKDVSAIDDLVVPDRYPYSRERYVMVRLDDACAGAAWILPKLWLYDWKQGSFCLARASTVDAGRRIIFFQTQPPTAQARKNERHPTLPDLVTRRGAGELAGCEPSVVARLEGQGAITFVRHEEGRVWYRRSDAVNLRALANGSPETAKADAQRKAAAMWMLHVQGVTYSAIGEAFGLSLERIRQIVLKYQRALDARARQAERWLQQQTQGRVRAAARASVSKEAP